MANPTDIFFANKVLFLYLFSSTAPRFVLFFNIEPEMTLMPVKYTDSIPQTFPHGSMQIPRIALHSRFQKCIKTAPASEPHILQPPTASHPHETGCSKPETFSCRAVPTQILNIKYTHLMENHFVIS